MAALSPRPSVWDIVRVAFPYADAATTRHRPALVIAVPDVHPDFGVIWLAMITSARHVPWPFDVPVATLDGTGLSHPSVVRTAKLAVLDIRLAERIGQLAIAGRTDVRTALRRLLDATLSPRPLPR
jgi:mRNA interferase MazF